MKETKYVGPSELTLLQLIFIVLKLCKVIDWKWVWVLTPTWIALVIYIVVIVIIFIPKKKRY